MIYVGAAVFAVLALAAFGLMIWGWLRRRRRQSGVGELPTVPDGLPTVDGHPAKYVATTTADQPYDRIAVRGLGFRGFAVAHPEPGGLLIVRDGEPALWIEKAALVGISRATWTIDRVVEPNGLHLVRWVLGDADGSRTELDPYLRVDEPEAFDAALRLASLAQRPVPERAAGETKGTKR